MPIRTRLPPTPRRRWLAAGLALTLLTSAIAVIAVPGHIDTPPPTTVPAVPQTGPVAAVSSGFESSSLQVEGWQVHGSPRGNTAGPATVVGAGEARTGRRALRLDVGLSASETITVRYASIPVGQGLLCDVGAWARQVRGAQRVTVAFLGANDQQISARDQQIPVGSGVWSRATVRAMSPPATASMRISITGGSGSAGTWDDLDVTCPRLPNRGFEVAKPTSPSHPSDWTVVANPGTSVLRSGDAERGHALRLTDDSATEAVTVRSSPVPVPPALEITVSARVKRISGDQQVLVRFLDADRRRTDRLHRMAVTTTIDRQRRWSGTVSVPTGARWATVEVVSTGPARSAAVWDDLDVRPTDPAKGRIGAARAVSDLKGYLNTATSRTVTVDGRALIYTIVAGAPAELQVADLATGRLVDRHVVPGALTGWALATAPDQKSVYLGGATGHLFRYDPVERTLSDLGRATKQAQVIFDLTVAADGRVWGGSYPRGELWVHDPRQGKFTSIAPLGAGREYARSLALEGNTLYVGTGSVAPSIVAIDLRAPDRRREIALPGAPPSGLVTELRVQGRLLAAKLPDGTRGVHDLQRSTWDTPVSRDTTGRQLSQSPSMAPTGNPFYYFSNGRLWRVRPDRPDAQAKVAIATSRIPPGRERHVVRATLAGRTSDWLVSYDGSRAVVAIDVGALPDPTSSQPIPKAPWVKSSLELAPRPLRIKSLGIGTDGVLWAGGFGGSSLSSLDTRKPKASLEPRVGGADSPREDVGFGEVEGSVSNGKYTYFGTYTNARIFRYDTRRPWVNGQNPAQVADLGASWGQDRPLAWAKSPERTYFGTIPLYGRNGGVLGWFEGTDTTPVVVPTPVPNHSIVGLAATDEMVYGTTSRWGGLGAPPAVDAPAVFAYDTMNRRVLWTTPVGSGLQSAGSVLVTRAGRLFVLTRSELRELDRTTGRTIRLFPLGTSASTVERATFAETDLAEGGGRVWAATPDGGWAVDLAVGTFTQVVGKELGPPQVEFLADAAYFPAGRTLMGVAAP